MAMEIHWKAPIQAKGFLKLLEMFIALLAFSLVAGFSVTHNIDCKAWIVDDNTNIEAVIKTTVKYPFSKVNVNISVAEPLVLSLPGGYKQAGQFFVVWGIFSIFYGIIALLVYMLLTANRKLEWLMNYLILTDLIFHVMWALCWLIAGIEWAVAQVQLKNYLTNINTNDHSDYLFRHCPPSNVDSNDAGSYVQAAIADVFGFTSFFLWAINIYWVFIDTGFFIEWRNKREHTPLVE